VIMKKVAWTVIIATASAGGAALAARLAHRVWCLATGEPPPNIPWWSRWLVGAPVTAGVNRAIQPS